MVTNAGLTPLNHLTVEKYVKLAPPQTALTVETISINHLVMLYQSQGAIFWNKKNNNFDS